MAATLVLNATYEPINVVSRNDAIGLVLASKAEVIEVGHGTIRSKHVEVPVPAVILLTRYVKVPYLYTRMPFSKTAVLERDRYTCAYCGKHATTVDHVHPRALGGKWTFENCVAACAKCNHRKGSRTLTEMGWTLPFTPVAPMAPRHKRWPVTNPLWEPYLN
jgi:5-methylcytosine-specific restriction endonuclease McrA